MQDFLKSHVYWNNGTKFNQKGGEGNEHNKSKSFNKY